MTGKPTVRFDDIVKFKEELSELPQRAPEEITATEAVVFLAPALRRLRQLHYSWAAIQALLRARGIVVGDAVLRKRVAKAGGGAMSGRRAKNATTAVRRDPGAVPSVDASAAAVTPPADLPVTATATVFLEAASEPNPAYAVTKDKTGAAPAPPLRPIRPPSESPLVPAADGGTKRTPIR